MWTLLSTFLLQTCVALNDTLYQSSTIIRAELVCGCRTCRREGPHCLPRDAHQCEFRSYIVESISHSLSRRTGRTSFTNGQIRLRDLSHCAEYEIRLGKDRIGVFTGDKDKNTIKQFVNSYVYYYLVLQPIQSGIL